MKYTIKLSEAEQKALAFVVENPEDWINNVVKDRCRIAIEEIVQSEVNRKLISGETISGNKEDLVINANIESFFERKKRLQEEFRKLQEEQQG